MALLLILAVALRVYDLSAPSLWFDEAFSWTLATQFSATDVVSRTARDVHPPLYYLLLKGWTTVFGDSVLAMRLMSVVLGFLTIAVLPPFCRACFSVSIPSSHCAGDGDRRGVDIGLFTAAACAISSSHIQWSQEVRMYALCTLLVMASAWMLLQALQHVQHVRYWMAYSAASVALLYSHNYAIFSIAGQCLFVAAVLLTQARRSGPASSANKSRSRTAIIAFVTIAAAYAPWVPVLIAQTTRVKEAYWIGSVRAFTVPDCWYRLFFPNNDSVVASRLASLSLFMMLVAVCAGFLWSCDWRRHLVVMHAACPVLCSLAASVFDVHIIEARCYACAFPFVATMLAATCIEAVTSQCRVVALAVTIVLGVAYNGLYRSDLHVTERPGVRGAVNQFRWLRTDGEQLLVRHPCVYFSAKYYLRGDVCPELYLPTGVTQHFTGQPILQAADIVGPDDIPGEDGQSLWVLDTSGFNLPGARFSLPRGWKPVEGTRRTFREAYYFQKDVSLTRYEFGTDWK